MPGNRRAYRCGALRALRAVGTVLTCAFDLPQKRHLRTVTLSVKRLFLTKVGCLAERSSLISHLEAKLNNVKFRHAFTL